MTRQKLIKTDSYTPYSGSEEFCLIGGKSGLYYPGVRVENISFPLTISAVQAAVCSCLANCDVPLNLYQENPVSELSDFWIDELSLTKIHKVPDTFDQFDPVIPEPADITEILHQLCDQSITPNSKFPVSAILETKKGYVTGVNVEVNAWSLGLCAERVAISRALASGIRDFVTMYIYAPKSEFCSPCGACRQVLFEFMADKPVTLHHSKTTSSKHFVHHLLPYGFTSSSLKNQ